VFSLRPMPVNFVSTPNQPHSIERGEFKMITDGTELLAPAYYGANGAPHSIWTRLRHEAPVHWCEPAGYQSFWAITRHADICEISKRPEDFSNAADGIVILSDEQRSTREDEGSFGQMRTIIEMDPPEHRDFRKVASHWFTPRALSKIDAAIDRSARDVVDRLAGETGEGECDFAIDVATAHPLRILSTALGVPRDQEPDILRLTNELFGAEDPDLQRKGQDRQQAIQALGLELFQLFSTIIEDRRQSPRDDLATIFANAEVDGKPMGPMETFGYFLIIFSAGHDTTKNALAGGLQALIEDPEEFQKLRNDPSLVNKAVEEIVRWTSPVNYMKRTAMRDLEVRGQKIAAGDHLALFYASANRDEDLFENPFEFRVDRNPNRHLGFGIGEHFCLGANFARRSQAAILRELVDRLEWAEVVGEVAQIHSSFVVGLKSLPVRYRLRGGAKIGSD
jgi:cytochrome P450